MSMLLDNWLAQRAVTCPDRLALRAGGTDLTYAELEREATAAARRLAARGARRGSVVAIELEAGRDHVVCLHALMKLGAVAYPVNTRLAAAERERQLEPSGAALTIASAGDLAGPEADLPLLGEHDLDAVQCRLLTSGTSGPSRQVSLTYGNFLWSAVGSAFSLGVEPSDRWLCCLPLYHVAGLSIVMRAAIYGTGAVVQPGFDPDAVAGSLAEDGISIVSLVATQLRALLDAGVDLSGPRAIVVGGGPVPVEMLAEATDRGATVVQTYGLTEACSQVTTLAPAEARARIGSAGRPLLTTRLRIEAGEVLVQGPTVAPGAADEDGWLRTGDLGRIDEDGFLYVTGRRGDLIVTGGENVVPDEVEEVLLSHPLVADAAVVGRPDRRWQEAVTAVVVVRDGAELDPDDLRRHCAERLAGYKVPKAFERAGELPRTASGKLLRRELRRATPGGRAPSR